MLRSHYDVGVVGAGPAGSICATLLARRGLSVLLVHDGGPSSPSLFPETLAAPTLRVLEGHGIPVDFVTEGARPCRRIATAWESPEANVIEIEWLRCRPGLTVDRNSFDPALRSVALSAGATMIEGRATRLTVPADGLITLEVSHDGRSSAIACRVVIEATGRAGLPGNPALDRRIYFDRLIAIARHVSGATPTDYDQLRVEVTENGWWYLAEHPREGLIAVFLTDGDLFDHARGDFDKQLASEFLGTCLPLSLEPESVVPGSRPFRDARTSSRRLLGRGGWLPIGDAAYTIDPLSGSGLNLAARSAGRAAIATFEYLSTDDHQPLIELAIATSQELNGMLKDRSETYQSAASRFPTSPFWKRRLH